MENKKEKEKKINAESEGFSNYSFLEMLHFVPLSRSHKVISIAKMFSSYNQTVAMAVSE